MFLKCFFWPKPAKYLFLYQKCFKYVIIPKTILLRRGELGENFFPILKTQKPFLNFFHYIFFGKKNSENNGGTFFDCYREVFITFSYSFFSPIAKVFYFF